MRAKQLLSKAKAAGVHLRVEAGKVIAGPKAALTEELLEAIRANKPALIDLLGSAVPPVTDVTQAIGNEGTDVWDYTIDDLKELRRLIRELGQLERWTDEELADAIDQSNRMAPVNVATVLRQLREWTKAALAPWPEKPTTRAPLKLCRLVVIQGGKSTPADQAKCLDAGKEAA